MLLPPSYLFFIILLDCYGCDDDEKAAFFIHFDASC